MAIGSILSIVFGVILVLLMLGGLYRMYIRPLVDKKLGNVEVIANNKQGFKCKFYKDSKKVDITFKAPYANSARAALTDMVKEMQKIDLSSK